MIPSPETVPLSVIIPTYNRAGFVVDCLRSLRACGLPEVEIIVADDGSTDSTVEMVRADPDARLVVVPHSGGPATPRNRGFELSHGRYVAFLDSDDQWLPGAPARAMELLDRYPEVDVLFADARMGNPVEGFRSWIELAGEEAFLALPHRELEQDFWVFDRLPFFRRMAQRNPVFIGATILRREAFQRAGPFDPELVGTEDWEMWLRMALQATFGFLHAPLARYTRHVGSLSSDRERMTLEFFNALRKVRQRCANLAPEESRLLARQMSGHLYSHAYLAYDSGRYSIARGRFGRLIREVGLQPRALIYWLLCALPLGLAGSIRRLKHSLSARLAGAPGAHTTEAP